MAVNAEPNSSAVAASNKFCTAGKTDAGSVVSMPRCVLPQTTINTGAAATPPCIPASTSASNFSGKRFSDQCFAPPSQARVINSPIFRRNSASRTTINSQGCLFSAFGARTAAFSKRSMVASSTGLSRNCRWARCCFTSSKKASVIQAPEWVRRARILY